MQSRSRPEPASFPGEKSPSSSVLGGTSITFFRAPPPNWCSEPRCPYRRPCGDRGPAAGRWKRDGCRGLLDSFAAREAVADGLVLGSRERLADTLCEGGCLRRVALFLASLGQARERFGGM